MKRLMLIAFLSTFALAVQAEEAAPQPAAAEEVVEITGDSVKTEEIAAVEKNCIRATGTRIQHRDKDGCTGLAGRSYTGDELRRTGATRIGEALIMLDPSVSGRR